MTAFQRVRRIGVAILVGFVALACGPAPTPTAATPPAVAPAAAVMAVLDQLTAVSGTVFGVDLTGVRLQAADTDWSWGDGHPVRADGASLVALLSGRTLPDSRTLPRG